MGTRNKPKKILFLPIFQILFLVILVLTQNSFRTQSIPTSSYLALTPDSKILFGLSQSGTSALLEGWSGVEEWGVWSEKPTSRMAFQLQARDLNQYTIRIAVNYFYVDYPDGFKFSLFINDKKYSENVVTRIAPENFILINLDTLTVGDNLSTLIRFDFKTLISPRDLGVSEDERLLGIGLKSVELVPTLKL